MKMAFFYSKPKVLVKYSLILFFALVSFKLSYSQTKTDSLKLAINQETNLLQKANLLNELAVELKSTDLESAFQNALKAKEISLENGYIKTDGISRSVLGLLYSYSDKMDSAIYWNLSAIPILLPTGDSLEISKNYNRLGANYLLINDYKNAATYILLAVRWANNSKIKAIAFNNLGMISKKNGDFAEAVNYYWNALKNYELLNEPKSKAKTMSNLGSLYIQKKEYKKAHQLFEEALEFAKITNDPEVMGQALSGLGITTGKLGNKSEAIGLLTKAAEINKSTGQNIDYATQIVSIADLQHDLKLYKLSEKNYKEAEQIFIKHGDKTNLAVLYNNFSDLLLSQNLLNQAVIYLEKANSLSDDIKDVNYKRLITKNLSDVYENLGQTSKALKYRKLYEKLNDEIVNVAENVKYAELNHSIETTKKEKKIKLQDQQISEMESNQKHIFWIIGFLVLGPIAILFLFTKRIKNQQLLEENISSISKQIASLTTENIDLKSKLVQTEQELRDLEVKYSTNKEKLPANLTSLSKREFEVLLFIAEGLSDKEIADKIFVSINTVRTHIRRIYDKLMVNNRLEAVGLLNKYQLLSEA